MRTRKEIEQSCERGDGFLNDSLEWQILEVLLDIRDLLDKDFRSE